MNNWTRRLLEDLERDYDGDRDLIPGAPRVTYTDFVLLQAINELIAENDELIARVEHLETVLQAHLEQ